MLHKTKGIALSYIRYRESSIISKIYTEDFGIQTYIVNGVRSASSKTNRIALYQPLTLLDLVVYHKGKQDSMHRISEIKCYHPFNSLPYEVSKSSIALFASEILSKTLKEEEANLSLFNFLEKSILYLDAAASGYENFHIQFLVQLASFLGFGIENISELEGELKNNHFPQFVEKMEINATEQLIMHDYGVPVVMNRIVRGHILEKLLFFYKIHVEGFGEVKSLDVLRETLR